MSYSSWPAVSKTLSTISSPSTLTLKIQIVWPSSLFSPHQQPNSYTKFWAMRTVGGNSSKSRPLFSASALQTRLVLPTLSPTNTTFLLILGRKYYSVRSSHNNNIASILLLSTRNYQRNAALCRTLDFWLELKLDPSYLTYIYVIFTFYF